MDVDAALRSGLRRMKNGKQGYSDRLPPRLLYDLRRAPLVDEKTLATGPPHRRLGKLSKRERQVLAGMSHGLTNAMIAELFGIQEATVKTHIQRMLLVMKAKNRTHAVAIGLREGIIT
jgi:DNA-binding NarL/FixJ family response regulator